MFELIVHFIFSMSGWTDSIKQNEDWNCLAVFGVLSRYHLLGTANAVQFTCQLSIKT